MLNLSYLNLLYQKKQNEEMNLCPVATSVICFLSNISDYTTFFQKLRTKQHLDFMIFLTVLSIS